MPYEIDFGELDTFVLGCLRRSPGVGEILAGSLDVTDVPRIAARHYAEIRAFIDIKLPERLRLSPYGDVNARKYFTALYVEENGEFEDGNDHAAWFLGFCIRVGLTQQNLDDEVETYFARFEHLKHEIPSEAVIARELAISYAWESTMTLIGQELVTRLVEDLGIESDSLSYFSGHMEADEEHSQLARRALQAHVRSTSDLEAAMKAIEDDIVNNSPWSDLT